MTNELNTTNFEILPPSKYKAMFKVTITNETTNDSRTIPFATFVSALNFIDDVSFYNYWTILEKSKTYFKVIDKNNQIITAKIG